MTSPILVSLKLALSPDLARSAITPTEPDIVVPLGVAVPTCFPKPSLEYEALKPLEVNPTFVVPLVNPNVIPVPITGIFVLIPYTE